MEFFGLMAFLLLITYSSYPTRTKRLERQMKILKRDIKGSDEMSKLISELKGKQCVIKSEDPLFSTGNGNAGWDVVDVDDEWIKIRSTNKKGVATTKIIRIDTIQSIELLGE